MLRIGTDCPEEIRPALGYTLRVLGEGVGVQLRIAAIADGDICYSAHRPDHRDTPWIPADFGSWGGAASLSELDHTPWFGRLATDPDAVFPGDLFLGLWTVLSGRLESDLPRNAFGVPMLGEATPEIRRLFQRPIASEYVRLFQAMIRTRWETRIQCIPLWPDDCRSALVLSHDVDRPLSRPDAQHYRRRVARDFKTGHLASAARAAAGYVKNVVLKGDVMADADADPNFGFRAWQRFEATCESRSAFYVATRHSAEPGAQREEVNYDFRAPAILETLKSLVGAGWEIGLHASIACRDEPWRFREERDALARAVGTDVFGLRHHYWALDASNPADTLRQHADAGFRYDSSLGFNDSPGFRRGLAWPFSHVDPATTTALDILQIPPTLMDGGIFYDPSAAADGRERIRRHIDTVFSVGGAVVLNWHVEQSNPERLHGAGPALMDVLREYRHDTSIYRASPLEMADWWLERRRRIFG